MVECDVKSKGMVAERDTYKALIVEVQVIQHWCYSSCPTPPRFSTADKCVSPIVSMRMMQT